MRRRSHLIWHIFLFVFSSFFHVLVSHKALCIYIKTVVGFRRCYAAVLKTNTWTLRKPTSFDVNSVWVCVCLCEWMEVAATKANLAAREKKNRTNSAKHQIEWRIMEILHILMTLHLSFLSFHCRCWLFTITFFCSYTALLFGFSGPDFFCSLLSPSSSTT